MRKLYPLLVVALACGCDQQPPLGAEVPSTTAIGSPTDSELTTAPTDEELAADAVLRFVLTAEELKSTREFYGTPGHNEMILLAGPCPWPKCEYPSLAGYTLHRRWREELSESDKVKTMGVRLDKFELHYQPSGKFFFDTGIVISIENAGGTKNGNVIGGCTVYLTPRKVENGWVMDFGGLED